MSVFQARAGRISGNENLNGLKTALGSFMKEMTFSNNFVGEVEGP